jgi:uncharacterized phage protein (TIGR02216 family)
MNEFPWGNILQLGIGRLRLSPEQFWRSTLRELVLAAGLVPSPNFKSGGPLLRQSLFEMMENYPDAE